MKKPCLTRTEARQIAWQLEKILGWVHVGTSEEDVIRQIMERAASFPPCAKAFAMRQAVRQHRKNGALYMTVMGASFHRPYRGRPVDRALGRVAP